MNPLQSLFGPDVIVTDNVAPEAEADAIYQIAITDQGLVDTMPLITAMKNIDFTPDITDEVTGMLVANVLQWPVKNVAATKQVGRFVQVDYQPITAPDPDIIIALETSPAAHDFHAAMLAHQEARSNRGMRDDPQAWYRRVMHSAQELVPPLLDLQASQPEAAFVLLWAIGNASQGHTIPEHPQVRASVVARPVASKPKPKPKPIPIQTNPKAYDEGDLSIYDAMSMME